MVIFVCFVYIYYLLFSTAQKDYDKNYQYSQDHLIALDKKTLISYCKSSFIREVSVFAYVLEYRRIQNLKKNRLFSDSFVTKKSFFCTKTPFHKLIFVQMCQKVRIIPNLHY